MFARCPQAARNHVEAYAKSLEAGSEEVRLTLCGQDYVQAALIIRQSAMPDCATSTPIWKAIPAHFLNRHSRGRTVWPI